MGKQTAVETIIETMNLEIISGDKPTLDNDGNETSLFNSLSMEQLSQEDLLISKHFNEFIWKTIKICCTCREEFILRHRILNNKTLKEIGKMIGLTHERVRQLEDRALKKVRNGLKLLKIR